MKKLLICILIFLPFHLLGQQITNIIAKQQGKKIIITYDLTSSIPKQSFTVKIYCSKDNGQSWGSNLNYVTGDVGQKIKAGTGKKITWDVLSEYDKLLGSDIRFKIVASALASECPSSFTDARDKHVYPAVKIGNQCWMAENLAYLPSVSPSSQGSNTSSHYYVYGYNGTSATSAKATANYKTYGVLYNWPAAMNESSSSNSVPSGVQGACPTGWHLPGDAEWTILTDYLGGKKVAGTKMKSTGGWYNSGNGTNKSGFSGLPGGYRYSYGYFNYIGKNGYWWSSTDYITSSARYRYMYYDNGNVYRYDYDKKFGFAVRCLRDKTL